MLSVPFHATAVADHVPSSATAVAFYQLCNGFQFFFRSVSHPIALLATLQAVMASSLVAVANADPEGEGWISQRAERGFLLILTVIARPTLMLVGLIGAIYLSRIGFSLLADTFGRFAQSSLTGQLAGPVVIVFMLLLFSLACVTLVRTCYGLVQILPDQILAFVGGHASDVLGAVQAMNEVGSKFLGFGDSAGNAASSGIQAMKDTRARAAALKKKEAEGTAASAEKEARADQMHDGNRY